MQITRNDIIAANRDGMTFGYDCHSFYTPVLQMAARLGIDGVDLSESPTVTGWRRGFVPESGLSYNHSEGRCEFGLSMMSVNGSAVGFSDMWMADRKKVEVTGLLLPTTGSDGEPLILPYGVDNLDA